MKGKLSILIAVVTIFLVSYEMGGQTKSTDKKDFEAVKEEVASTNYQDVRIKKLPIALQCWTFRKFTFFETMEKAKELGIKYLQPYPGQTFSPDMPGVKFDHNLDEDLIKLVKNKLNEYGLALVSYGVVDFENTEESMGKVFGFAKEMGIKTIVIEPESDDPSLLEQMVKKYDINIAIHNHPEPSKYFHPETVLDYAQGIDERIGSCADTGPLDARWNQSC